MKQARRARFQAIGIALAIGLAGCSDPSKTAPAASHPAVADAPWNWDAFPLADRMRLGVLPCQLQPRGQIAIHSPLMGMLRVYLDQPQTARTNGFVWAEFEPEILQAEATALEEARAKLDEREKLQAELEIPRQKLQLERQIEEMQRQVALLRLLSTNQELADLALNVGVGNANPLRPDSLAKAETELRLLTQSMDYLRETNLVVLGIDLPGLRSDWQRRKLEFDRRQSQARLRMPFSGQLTISLPLVDGVREYPVNAGQELAVVRDLSRLQLRVSVSNPAWTALPTEHLTALIRLPSGRALEAPFAYQRIERVQNREESAYYFLFTAEQAPQVARLLGTDVSCELWLHLPQPVRRVPKLTLILHQPAAFQAGQWGAGVAAAFPGASQAVEGQIDLGILPAAEMKAAPARP